jgi:membrane protein implicated in regulation of membrane protease activity
MKRNKLLTAANAAIIMYYMIFFLWAMLLEPEEGESVVVTAYSGFIAHINPFTIGAYLLGVVALLNLKYCQSKAYRIGFFVSYCFLAVCSLVAIMGMTYWWELLMYVPHVIIIVAAIMIVSRRNHNKRDDLQGRDKDE